MNKYTNKIFIRNLGIVFLSTVVLGIAYGGAGPSLYKWVSSSFGEDKAFVAILFMASWVFIIPSIIYLLIVKINIKELMMINKFKVSNFLLSFLALWLVYPLVSALSLITMKLGAVNEVETLFTKLANLPFSTVLIAIAIMPAIIEEFVFRGVVFSHLKKVNLGVAVIISALLFGLMHMNINQFSYTFLVGIVFALIAEANNSIVVPTILHFIFNALPVVALSLVSYIKEYSSTVSDPKVKELIDTALNSQLESSSLIAKVTWLDIGTDLIIGLGFFVLSMLIINIVAKRNGKNFSLRKMFKGELPFRYAFHPLLIIAFIILTTFMVLRIAI